MQRHLKRLKAPKSWPIQRKGIKFIARPLPGPHKLKESITLNTILKDILKLIKTTKESKKLLNKGLILIDNKIIKQHRLPVGVMDIVSIPSLNQYYKVLYNTKGKFILEKTTKEQAQEKTCKIINKKILKNKKTQINLYDSKNILVTKDTYKVGDSVIIKENKITKHLKFEKGAKIYIVSGKYKGQTGILEDIQKFNGRSPDIITLKLKEKEIKTKKDYAFVIE